ncbi:MAG: hypothetical protein H0U27_11695, partial [Nitrosopumilus sp.]|nr:hypothetical protein [Nitrosopumilus sp.]
MLEPEERKDDRNDIRKYSIMDKSNLAIEKIVSNIRILLQEQEYLVAMFPYDEENEVELQNLIKNNNYLIVNGKAVCFSEGRGDSSREMNDKYFTEMQIKNPVRCSKGHFFDQKSAQLWKSACGDTCPDPYDEKHPIGNLDIDLVTENLIELVLDEEKRHKDGISTYLFKNTNYQGIVKIAEKIAIFLDKNPKYCPIFSYQGNIQELEKQLQNKKYLIVNKYAVCLSEELSDFSMQWNDKYLTGMPIQNPVRCPLNHLLEHNSALYWKSAKGDVCPCPDTSGEEHSIGNLEIDILLKEAIEQIQEGNKIINIMNSEKMLINSSSNQDLNNVFYENLINYLTRFQLAISMGGIKAIATTVLKNIPVVRAIYAIPMSFIRYKKGENIKLIGEIFSGCSQIFFPVYGFAMSLITDGTLFIADIDKVLDNEIDQILKLDPKAMDLPALYTFFGIKGDNPSKEEVDSGYRLTVKSMHTDRFRLFSKSDQKGTR